MYVKAERAALECLVSSLYRRVGVAGVRRVPEEGYVLMTNIYDISKAEARNKGGAYMDRKRVIEGASRQGQGVHLHL
jgi:hypothetical protein